MNGNHYEQPFRWQWRVVHRMMAWALEMMLIWGVLPFLCGGWMGLYSIMGLSDYNEVTLCLFFFCCFWSIGGFITGALAGFLAPAAESLQPFRSKFFRQVSWTAFRCWFWSGVGVAACFIPLFFGVVSLLPKALWPYERLIVDGLWCLLPLSYIVVFGLSVWRALNRALTSEQQ